MEETAVWWLSSGIDMSSESVVSISVWPLLQSKLNEVIF